MDYSNASDESLAALVQGNNQAAFGVLMQRYQARLLRYGHRFLSDQGHIEDIVQDVFIKAYQNMKSFDTTRKFSPWIYRIAHNAFVNALRKHHRDPHVFVNFDTFVAHPIYEAPVDADERHEMQELAERELQTLPALYREVIILFYIEELSYQEIAEVLRIPIGTVGIRLHRARQALKKKIIANE